MSEDQMRGKSKEGMTRSGGLKRRDLLLAERMYKVHLDGYNQMDLITPARVRRPATRFSTSPRAH
jgi:hypothetical protein